MLSRIVLSTCVSALLAFSLVGAADEKKAPDDPSELKIRLRLNAIETAKMMERYESLVQREMNLQGSVRACMKSGDPRLGEYQQALQEAQGDLEITKKKLIALEAEKGKLSKRLGGKNAGAKSIDQTEKLNRTLEKILERLDRIEKRLERIEKRRP